MKIIAVNGSPRKNWNTDTLLQKALEGAKSQGAQTSLFHLYDIDYKGCTSCFACKLKNSKNKELCAMQDELTPVLEQILSCDALILGSPIYLGNVTGEMRSFLERLIFPLVAYDFGVKSNFTRKIKSCFIYTMNVPRWYFAMSKYKTVLKFNDFGLKKLNGRTETVFTFDTTQFDDYAKYDAGMFSPKHKAAVKAKQFGKDTQKVYDVGCRLAKIN